jgi:membrane-associated phospholipid phosphatase
VVSARTLVVKAYRFVDFATQGYLVLVGALIFCFHGQTVPEWRWLLLAHVLLLTAVHELIVFHERHPASKVLDLLRHFYPVLLYAGFYAETGALDQMFIRGYLDPVVIGWDQALFGCQPSLVFMRALPYLLVSEVFYAAYFSYYLMIGGIGLILYLDKNRQHFFHYVSVISFVFYACYLVFIFVPVIGPPVFFRTIQGYSLPANLQSLAGSIHDPAAVQAGVFYQVMKRIYAVFEAPGAAIPSSHVAVAWATVFFSFRYIHRIRWWHAGLTVLLCLATVYCHYHYGCDVLAGIAVALLLIPLANWIYLKLDSRAGPAPGPGTARSRGGLRTHEHGDEPSPLRLHDPP